MAKLLTATGRAWMFLINQWKEPHFILKPLIHLGWGVRVRQLENYTNKITITRMSGDRDRQTKIVALIRSQCKKSCAPSKVGSMETFMFQW